MAAYRGATRVERGFLLRDSRAAPAVHQTHIYLHAPTRDAPPRRDQSRGEPASLCRFGQHGSTGEWSAEDGAGNPLEVRSGADGRLEIVHYPNDRGDQQGELGMKRPPGAAGEIPPGGFGGTEDRRRAHDLALIRPDRRGGGDVASTAALQRELDRVYGAR